MYEDSSINVQSLGYYLRLIKSVRVQISSPFGRLAQW